MDELVLKPNYIITYTKKQMSPTAPQPGDIDIKDIAHCLSYMCRANGHIRSFYSVAQHCISCYHEAKARGYTDKVCLALLLHDASEAYLADITRPVKKSLNTYLEIESVLQTTIYRKYGLESFSQKETELIDEIDNCMLQHEFINLADIKIFHREFKLYYNHDFSFRPFEEVEREYLDIFEGLCKG